MKPLPNASKHCFNCEHPMTQDALYCPKCSQKYTDGKIPLKTFLSTFLESLLNFDSKVFRTLRDLFIPGKLTQEFFKGRHKSYVHPVRFFLVVTIALIAALHLRTDDSEIGNSTLANIESEVKLQQLKRKADTIRQDLQVRYPESAAAMDSFYLHLLVTDSTYNDSTLIDDVFYNDSLIMFTTSKPIKYKREDFVILSTNELVEKYYPDASFFMKLVNKQIIRLIKDGRSFLPYLIDKVSWMMLLSLPFFALFLKLLYWRYDFYYIEHLTFTIHLHTFMFLFWIITIILNKLLSTSLIIPILFLIISAYILYAMKQVYAQTWLKTGFKFVIANFVYWIILSIAIIITGAISFLLF